MGYAKKFRYISIGYQDPISELKVPVIQDVHFEEPVEFPYEPVAQNKHTLCLIFGLNFPAWHCWHDEEPCELTYVPDAHSEQADLPISVE